MHALDRKHAVVVSTGRTGTMAVAQLVGQTYPNVRALHEPRPSYRLRVAGNRYWAGRIDRDRLARILHQARASQLEQVEQPLYLESNPYLSAFLDVLDEVFSRPLVIHLVRDPRTFVASAINWGVFRGVRGLANAFVPYWLPKPEHSKRSRLTWSAMSQTQRFAWYWRHVNEQIEQRRERFGDRYLRLRFEDLFGESPAGWQELLTFLDLPWRDEVFQGGRSDPINASPSTRTRFSDWKETEREALLQICGASMSSYGYSAE